MNLGPSKSLVFPEHEKMPGVRCPGAGASTFGLPREGKLHRCPSCATPFQCIAPPRQTKLQERRATSRQIVRDASSRVKEVTRRMEESEVKAKAAAKLGASSCRYIADLATGKEPPIAGVDTLERIGEYATRTAETLEDEFLTRKQKG